MCKTWALYYTCGHTFHFRLSKCRATVATQSRPGRPYRPACMGYATLVFNQSHPCGDCASTQRIKELKALSEQYEVGTDERIEAEAESGRELFALSKAFPIIERRSRKSTKPLEYAQKPTKELRGSLLRREVLEDDIKAEAEVDHEWTAYYEGWATSDWDSVDDSTFVNPLPWDTPIDHSDSDSEEEADKMWDDEDNITSTSCASSTIDYEAQHLLWTCEAAEPIEAHKSSVAEAEVNNTSNQPPTDVTNDVLNTIQQKSSPDQDHRTVQAPTAQAPSSHPIEYNMKENQKFKTLPPHLRRKVVAVNRRASASDCDDIDTKLIKQLKHFQFHTIITVNS